MKEELCFSFRRHAGYLEHLVTSDHAGWRCNLRLTCSDDQHAVSPLGVVCNWFTEGWGGGGGGGGQG